MSTVAIARSRMPMNAEDQLFDELARAYPTIPTHVVFAVMHQFNSHRGQCHDALRRAAPNYYEPPAQNHWHQERGRGDEQGNAPAIRPRSDSAGSISSNSSTDTATASKQNPGQQPRTSNFAIESRRYHEQYHPHIHEASAQMRNVTINEERTDGPGLDLNQGGWTGSPHPSRKPHPNFQMTPHINSPPNVQRPPFEGGWVGNHDASGAQRPNAFDQSFPHRNGDLRDSPNTPSPVGHLVPSHQAIPRTPPVSSGYYSQMHMHEQQYERQASAYAQQQQQHIQQGAVGGGYGPPQPQYMMPPTSSPMSHKSVIYIPMQGQLQEPPPSQMYRAKSPSQPPPPNNDSFSRNVPQTLPIYRQQSFQPQASSDSSPVTPGQQATTPGMYSHSSGSSGQHIQTPPSQVASSPYGHCGATGVVTTPGQYSTPRIPGGHYMSPQHQQPFGASSNQYGLPGPPPPQYHQMPVPHTYVNQPPPVPPPTYASPSGGGQSQHHHTPPPRPPPPTYPSEWSMQHQQQQQHNDPRLVDPRLAWPEYNQEVVVAELHHGDDVVHFRQSPPEGHMTAGTVRQQSAATTPEPHPGYRKSSLGEDSAYITTLLEHQRKRRASIQEELQCSLQHVSMLRQEVTSLTKEMFDRRKSRTNFTFTAEDVQRKKQENKKLQVDIHLLTMRIDAATPDTSTLRLGVLESLPPPRNAFYSGFPSGQSVMSRDQQQHGVSGAAAGSRDHHPSSATAASAATVAPQSLPTQRDFHHHHRDQPPAGRDPQSLRQRVPPPRPPPPSLPMPLRSTSAAAQPEREPAEPEQWKCSACTFANHPFLDKCEICEMPRMSPGSKGFG